MVKAWMHVITVWMLSLVFVRMEKAGDKPKQMAGYDSRFRFRGILITLNTDTWQDPFLDRGGN